MFPGCLYGGHYVRVFGSTNTARVTNRRSQKLGKKQPAIREKAGRVLQEIIIFVM